MSRSWLSGGGLIGVQAALGVGVSETVVEMLIQLHTPKSPPNPGLVPCSPCGADREGGVQGWGA